MGINFKQNDFENKLKEFTEDLQSIDVEEVEKRSMKRIASEMSEMVRLAVIAEDDITSPAINSVWDRGPGPSMSQESAWIVKQFGETSYTVEPHPKVEQRAVVLNFGYPGTITPNNTEYMKFNLNGVPIYRKEVPGPDETGYWQAAFNNLEKSGKVEEIMEEELQKEVDENV
jgi:hypothetical protein